MEGIVINYRRGKRTMHPKQMILEFLNEPHPSSLIGKKVFWESQGGKRIYGVITAVHGRKGAVRARFTRGLPGQAIGDKVYLVGSVKEVKSKPVKVHKPKKPIKEKTIKEEMKKPKNSKKPKAKEKTKEITKKSKPSKTISKPKGKPSK